jgi:serine phosphatase RsbU (regulator of sigma subunit)/outer membrane biosynthesis protein TonB
VSPFNSLRRETRAFGVRALAAMAVFCTLAIVLIAVTAAGSLANTEAKETGAPAQAADPAPAPEPALGAEQAPPEPAPAAESAPANEPATLAEPAPSTEPAPAPPTAPVEQPQPETAPAEEPAQQPAVEALALRAQGPAEKPPQDDESRGSDQPRGGEDRGGEDPSEVSGDEEPQRVEPGRAESRGGNSDRGVEPVEESTPVEQSESGDESDWNDEGERSEKNGRLGGERRSLTGRPNLTGALGALGAGAKNEGSVGAPVQNSPGGGSSTSPTPPAQPSFVEPSTGEEAQSAEPQPSAGTAQPPRTGRLSEGVAIGDQARRVSAPVDTPGFGTGGTGGTGGETAGTTPGGAGTGADVAEGFVPAPAASGDAFTDQVGRSQGGGDGSANPVDERAHDDEPGKGVAEIVRRPLQVANNVPDALKYALAALGALSVMLGVGYLLAAMRARSLARQRRELLQEVGLLQSALLPPVPEKLGSLRTSVAYRPSDGPGAGGDFYDVLPLAAGSVGFILGDVSGHGRGALARTAFMRYTLRAYLEAGLEPRAALQVAGRVIDENLGGDFATVLLAVHDPETGSLTYATAGHPAPIVVGPEPHHPVTAGSSPPIGVGVPTGLRQTTVPLVPGAVACLFTDGLMDARVAGGILGRGRLEELLREMGEDASARGLIDRVSQESRVLSDDIAAVVVSPTDGAVTAPRLRTEQLELSPRELEGPIAHRFLESCGVPHADANAAVEKARALAGASGAAILDVVFGDNPRVDVAPRDVDSIEAASRRAATH